MITQVDKDSLFNIFGVKNFELIHSAIDNMAPSLVEYYLFNHNSRKINNIETLINHPNIIRLPPLNAPTYDDVINESMKNIKKIENELKQ